MAIFEWRKFNFFDLKKDADFGKVHETLGTAQISAVTSGNNNIIICDSFGNIHVFSKSWEVVSFRGHVDFISHCALAEQINLLVTIGSEENDEGKVFKVWNVSKLTKTGAPCLRTVKTALPNPTALAVSDNGQYMAIGFDTGSVSLYRGDIGRDRSKSFKSLSAGTTKITGIEFTNVGKMTQMYLCSDSGILVYQLQNRDREHKIVLDTMCAPTRCCGLQRTQDVGEQSFMIGRDDAIYCYTSDGKGPCYALDGQKQIIQWFRSHLLTISKPSKNVYVQMDSVLTVIDVQNKFIVFSTPISHVVSIVIATSKCYIITKNSQVYLLDEKDIHSKLNVLIRKNLYDIAVRVAKNNQYGADGLVELFRQYGDHLYNKGDFSSAVEKYSKTIGYLEPSYVIRKFLDSRHITYLAEYLQEIHKQGIATADHTTLLLNCFTRLDRIGQLKDFLQNDENPDIMFDLNAAINVCRKYSVEDALALAKRNQKHELVLSILTEDLNNYKDTIKYLSDLPSTESEICLKKYGNILMLNSPNETTELLKNIFLNISKSHSNENLFDEDTNEKDLNPEDFFHLFKNYPDNLIDYLEFLIKNKLKCNQIIYNTLIELYLKDLHTNPESKTNENDILKFIKDYEEFYDKNHVLFLCFNYKFWSGVMLLYEEQKLYHLIVRYYLKNREYNNLLQTCKRLGSTQPSLWLQALTGLRNDKEAPSNLLSQILQVISQEKLQSPLQVLNCLAVENGPNLNCVRDYFMLVFHKEKESTKHEEELVMKYEKDSIELKTHIKYLQESAIEFRNTTCDTCHQLLTQPSLYFLCKHSYHQDCVRGYSENDKDCPVCHSKNLQLLNALQAQKEAKDQHETFHNLLDRSSEPFSVVAEYFGRGLFNKIVIYHEDDENGLKQNVISDQGKLLTSSVEDKFLYGPGAEARMRINEVKSNIMQNQPSEARLRINAVRNNDALYSTSLEANLSHINTRQIDNYPKSQITNVSTSISKNINNPISNNPFGDDDDDDDDIPYDESKNPFSDEPDNSYSSKDDYDNNLNPFA